MNVICFCGPSGVGKTTLIERVIVALKAQGQRVSVIKHAHKTFDIDHPGKDTYRHRQAGAFEVMIASGSRLAKMREYEVAGQPSIHQLLAEMIEVDWMLVEGFKHSDLHKIEVWRAAKGEAALYPEEPFIVAIATDAPAGLPQPTQRPVFDLADAEGLAAWLVAEGDRFEYRPELHR